MTIAGLILAGGASLRMGEDKAFARFNGRTLLEHMIERIEPQVSILAINANRNLGRYDGFDIPVLADNQPAGGPLAGVLAGLQWARDMPTPPEFVATFPIDTPFVPLDAVAQLDAGRSSRSTVAIAASGDRDHPIIGLWPVALADRLDEWRRTAKSRGIRGFLATCGFTVVHFGWPEPGLDPFSDINTPDELAEAESRPCP